MVKKKSAKAKKAALANAARGSPTASRRKVLADGRNISARNAVLSATELLELILCHVDMSTVLLAQLVSTTWHDIIQSSPLLQRHLFFAPAHPVPGSRTEPLHPPLIATHVEDEVVQAWIEKTATQPHKGIRDSPILAPTHNPLLKKYFGCFFTMLDSMADGVPASWRGGRTSEDVNYLTTGKLMGMGMAWPPPPRRLEHISVFDGRARSNYDMSFSWSTYRMAKQYRSVNVPDGITMGQLYDLVYAITFDRPSGRLSWVGWPNGKDFDTNLTPYHGLTNQPRAIWEPGSRLVNMSRWVTVREPRGRDADLYNWASTDCIVVGEEGVGYNFHNFCREHGEPQYDISCDRCRQGQEMRLQEQRKGRLRKDVGTLAPFFRCDEYQSGGILIEHPPISTPRSDEAADDISDTEASAEGTDMRQSLDDASSAQTGEDSSDYEPWDAAASDEDEFLR